MPSPGPRRLTPLSGIGIRYITIGGRRVGSAPRPPVIGRPSIQWASCVFKMQEPKEPTEPVFAEEYIPHTLADMTEVQFVNFNDPCD
jgi:hypothetical protein